ncbi:MAG: succinate dehydrogenase, cytochrome b556 subunit [Gammaproteobacteria bacterium]|nr:MAG: succinate dehydrogenase, cytochrome b556 subunit [Gammaproteobacteria bacterium]
MTTRNRPTSPHMLIYRPQLASVLSITHRASGVFLTLGMLLFAYWLLSAAAGPAAYEQARALLGSPLGLLALLAWSLALFYHLCNGVRHLFWDAGYGLDMDAANLSGLIVIAASLVLTAVTWLAAFGLGNGA